MLGQRHLAGLGTLPDSCRLALGRCLTPERRCCDLLSWLLWQWEDGGCTEPSQCSSPPKMSVLSQTPLGTRGNLRAEFLHAAAMGEEQIHRPGELTERC